MAIKRFPEDLNSPPGSDWPGWEHQHQRLEMLVDEYQRESERYDVLIKIQRMEELIDLEVSVYDPATDLTYVTQSMYNDPKKLAARLEELRPQLQSDSALEAYIAGFEKKYGKKDDGPDKPAKKRPDNKKKPKT